MLKRAICAHDCVFSDLDRHKLARFHAKIEELLGTFSMIYIKLVISQMRYYILMHRGRDATA